MSLRMIWCTATYGRPHLLPRVIYSFTHQTYQNRHLIIVDDGGQYGNQTGDKWELISLRERFPSLGAKRNFIARLAAERGADAVMPVDDDDIPLAWHTEASAAALEKAEWSRPSQILSNCYHGHRLEDGIFRANYTGHKSDQTKERMYHPCWAIKLNAFERVDGYPAEKSGNEDQGLMWALEAATVTQVDYIDDCGFQPSYIYTWGAAGNISGFLRVGDPAGADAWKKTRRELKPARIIPWIPSFNWKSPVILSGVLPRPF